ncbi:MAG: ABC transporter ATP-binding protein [Proteobacteria bacterium]|nr:ABC transporter ATP-binding protein [Pseudomonadota bacterium]
MAAVTLLETTAMAKRFGGLQAVDNVDFSLDEGEIRAIIGPNGAGKTTLVSLISGRLRPSSGAISFMGEDITRLKSYQRVGRGIVYTFQVTSIYRNLSCYENVALAAQRSLASGLFGSERAIAERVEAAIDQVNLTDRLDLAAGELPYGHQRLLEVAMGLALDPKLLILDEPTQGLSQGEITSFCELIRNLAKTATILLIEHNMPVVLELAERITVMDKGVIIAEGVPDEIERNPVVQRAYLGTGNAEA